MKPVVSLSSCHLGFSSWMTILIDLVKLRYLYLILADVICESLSWINAHSFVDYISPCFDCSLYYVYLLILCGYLEKARWT